MTKIVCNIFRRIWDEDGKHEEWKRIVNHYYREVYIILYSIHIYSHRVLVLGYYFVHVSNVRSGDSFNKQSDLYEIDKMI